MSGATIKVQGKKFRKANRWVTHSKRKRVHREAFILEEEPWTHKPTTAYAFVTRESFSSISPGIDVSEHDATNDSSQNENRPQVGKVSVFQLKTSDYFKFSEIGVRAHTEILQHYQRAADELRAHVQAAMPRFDLKVAEMILPAFEVPKLQISLPDFTAVIRSELEAIHNRVRESVAESVAAVQSSVRFAVDQLWLEHPEMLLDRLVTDALSDSERLSAIACAESLAFSDVQQEQLLSFLDQWIEATRFSEDEDEITALCSAIRKYSMNMGTNRYSKYAHWLAPSESERVHQDVELELAKGAYWHVRYLNTVADESLRVLRDALANVATDYLKPRVMLDKNYASTVKFAILGCLLMDARLGDAETSNRLWVQKAQLSMSWFDRLVAFELGKATKSISKRDQDYARSVTSLVDSLDRGGN